MMEIEATLEKLYLNSLEKLKAEQSVPFPNEKKIQELVNQVRMYSDLLAKETKRTDGSTKNQIEAKKVESNKDIEFLKIQANEERFNFEKEQAKSQQDFEREKLDFEKEQKRAQEELEREKIQIEAEKLSFEKEKMERDRQFEKRHKIWEITKIVLEGLLFIVCNGAIMLGGIAANENGVSLPKFADRFISGKKL